MKAHIETCFPADTTEKQIIMHNIALYQREKERRLKRKQDRAFAAKFGNVGERIKHKENVNRG